MRNVAGTSAALVLAAAMVAPAPTWAAEVHERPLRPDVRLRGAFGTVPGGPAGDPATAFPGRPLEAFIRSAPMQLVIDAAFEDVLSVHVDARSVDEDSTVTLSHGATVFEGPHVEGIAVISATVRMEEYGDTVHEWLVAVPDRGGGEDVLLEIVPPKIEVVSTRGSLRGEDGDGCYAYLCSDAGYMRPIEELETLTVGVGETLVVRADDGSGLVGYHGLLEPRGRTSGQRRMAEQADGQAIADHLELTGLEATSPGEWLLRLRVDFDRERGWLWHAYRLVATDVHDGAVLSVKPWHTVLLRTHW